MVLSPRNLRLWESRLSPASPTAHRTPLTSPGLTVKFAFNCILIDKSGIRHINLKAEDPIGAAEAAGKDAVVETPNPPIDVGLVAATA